MMQCIFNELLTEGPRESAKSAISMNIKESDYNQNLMHGVYLSIKRNSLTRRNISLFTVFDSSPPLIKKTLRHFVAYLKFPQLTIVFLFWSLLVRKQ